MATTDETYNGWTNRETWAAALWLGNDQGLNELARERVAQAITDYEYRCAEFGFETNHVGEMNSAGDALKELVDELLDPDEVWMTSETRHGMASDIGSLWRVNWAEVAKAFEPEHSSAR